MHVTIPGDRNVIKIKAENILKYKDLIIEILHMWKLKAKLMTVIIEATGAISKSIRQYLSNIPGKQKIKEMQKFLYWALHTHTTESIM